MLLPILKANRKLKDLSIAFIWASRGFFLSRGLEIKPSGYEDEKECKRPKEVDSAKTAQRPQVIFSTFWHGINSALNLPKIFKKMTTEDPKRWSLVENNGVVNGVVFKTNLLDSCLGRKTECA